MVEKIESNKKCSLFKLKSKKNDKVLMSCLGYLDGNIVGLESTDIESVTESQAFEKNYHLMHKASVIAACSEYSITDMSINNRASI